VNAVRLFAKWFLLRPFTGAPHVQKIAAFSQRRLDPRYVLSYNIATRREENFDPLRNGDLVPNLND